MKGANIMSVAEVTCEFCGIKRLLLVAATGGGNKKDPPQAGEPIDSSPRACYHKPPIPR